MEDRKVAGYFYPYGSANGNGNGTAVAPSCARTCMRLATAGSVDDGKSTLIGRLLHDAKAILADQLDDLHGRDGALDLSRLTDGLRAEREQGITIDVAYRYFATARRSFILADTPGHVQYTRNMVTGASTADLAIVLVDARNGVVEQTKRHAFIASLLGIPHMVAGRQQDGPRRLRRAGLRRRSSRTSRRSPPSLDVARHRLHPDVRRCEGDNVVDRSEAMDWYAGPPLLEHLETVQIAADRNLDELRFPVQYVIRDHATDYRGYAGRIASGVVRPGDEVLVLPGGQTTTVEAIDTLDGLARRGRPAAERDAAPDRRPRHLARRPHLRPRRPARRSSASSTPTSAGWPTRRCARAAATSSSTPRTRSR